MQAKIQLQFCRQLQRIEGILVRNNEIARRACFSVYRTFMSAYQFFNLLHFADDVVVPLMNRTAACILKVGMVDLQVDVHGRVLGGAIQ